MNEVIERENMAIPGQLRAMPAASVTPMALLQQAIAQGVDTDKLSALMTLQERWEANEARKAFVVALNAFKANPPHIAKNKTVDFTSAKGRTHYVHATLDNVSGVIGAALAKVGISHRWQTEQFDGGLIRVTCILTHELGHAESVWLQAARDESGNKNSIQAVGSAVTYLQRYTLLSATGMATTDQDDDGAGGTPIGKMDEGQKADWFAAIDGCADIEACTDMWAKIAEACTILGDIAVYDELKGAMARKRKAIQPAKAAA